MRFHRLERNLAARDRTGAAHCGLGVKSTLITSRHPESRGWGLRGSRTLEAKLLDAQAAKRKRCEPSSQLQAEAHEANVSMERKRMMLDCGCILNSDEAIRFHMEWCPKWCAKLDAEQAKLAELKKSESMTLEQELSSLLNAHSQENASNTPDWILAQFMLGCLSAFETATQQREAYYGRDPRPTTKGAEIR